MSKLPCTPGQAGMGNVSALVGVCRTRVAGPVERRTSGQAAGVNLLLIKPLKLPAADAFRKPAIG